MQAPPDACKALFRRYEHLRIAWVGHPDLEESNPGDFAIVQLMRPQEAGTPENPRILSDFWYADADGNRVDRGTIFDRDGGVKRDWHPDRVPVIRAMLNETFQYADGTPIHRRDLYTGKFMEAVNFYLTPRQKRIDDSKTALNRELQQAIDDEAAQAYDLFRWEQKQTGASRFGHIARKHVKESGTFRKIERGSRSKDWV